MKPICRLCSTPHWGHEPHKFASAQEARLALGGLALIGTAPPDAPPTQSPAPPKATSASEKREPQDISYWKNRAMVAEGKLMALKERWRIQKRESRERGNK